MFEWHDIIHFCLFIGFVREEERILPTNELQRKIWLLFEYPETSKWARAVAMISITVIITSICVFCIETMPNFKRFKVVDFDNDKNKSFAIIEDDIPHINEPFFMLETVCIIWFTFELVTRYVFWTRFVFNKHEMNLFLKLFPDLFSKSSAII